jgi:hypothetical protein
MTALDWAALVIVGVPALLVFVMWLDRTPDRKDGDRPPLVDADLAEKLPHYAAPTDEQIADFIEGGAR